MLDETLILSVIQWSLVFIFIFHDSAIASDKKLSVSFNPGKPFLGLLNISLEYQISSHLSICIFAEYLFRRLNHPDFVITLGPRYYFSEGKEHVSGFFGGVYLGYTWYKNMSSGNSNLNLGGELGYKLFFYKSLFMIPRGLVTHPIESSKVLARSRNFSWVC